jgi:Tir chaperone protein (CesT) family
MRRRIPDRDAVQQIIATFGQTIGIGDLGHYEYGFCCLVIDQDMVINIELNEAAQRLLLYSVVGRLGGERFPLLLEANHLGQGTGGGSLGLQPNTGSAVLSRGAGGRSWTCPPSAPPRNASSI